MSKTTLVIGLGEIGGPIYTLIRNAHPSAVGMDVDPVAFDGPTDIMHICFPFAIPGGFVGTCTAYADKYKPDIIAIHSTVEPGTTLAIQEATGRSCVYTPVRGKHTRMEQELQHYNKFVSGTDSEAVDAVRAQFTAAGMPTETMKGPGALELAKLLETTYFGLLIAWSQEMDRFATQVDGEYLEVAKFFSEIGYLPGQTFLPGFIGGHCVMPNIDILRKHFSSPMLEAVVDSNQRRAAELGTDGKEAGSRKRIEPVPMEDAPHTGDNL